MFHLTTRERVLNVSIKLDVNTIFNRKKDIDKNKHEMKKKYNMKNTVGTILKLNIIILERSGGVRLVLWVETCPLSEHIKENM